MVQLTTGNDEALAVAAESGPPRLTFDVDRFEPMRVMPVLHNLEHHPLLQLPALVKLAQRPDSVSAVRYHDDHAIFNTSFVDAPNSNPVAGRPEDIVRSIESAHAWLALLGVHNDPAYRELLDQVLESVRPVIESRDPQMTYRGSDIFVASPGAVTPYHMDHNSSFLLQIRGKKLLYVCDPLDRKVVSEESLELFHGTGSRDLVVYREEFDERAHKFQLEPGLGGYMPTTAPHWVKNDDNVSITISFTFYTSGLRRRKLLHRGNHLLRRTGLVPTPVGQSATQDAVKQAAFGALFGTTDLLKRMRGREVENLLRYYTI